jgi:hypothetical protein
MGKFRSAVARVRGVYRKAAQKMEMLSQEIVVRWQVAAAMPEAGATTAEYAVVLVAATGFAGLLVAILKSSAIRTLLTGIVQKALKV